MKSLAIRCTYSELAPIGALESIQGNLKQEHDIDRLAESMRRYGIVYPVFCWKPSPTEYRIVDGVHRLKALARLKGDGYEIEYVPVVVIPAQNLDEAKKLLLLAVSRYSKVTDAGFREFTQDLDWGRLKGVLSAVDFKTLFKEPKVSSKQLLAGQDENRKKVRLALQKTPQYRIYQVTFETADQKERYDAWAQYLVDEGIVANPVKALMGALRHYRERVGAV